MTPPDSDPYRRLAATQNSHLFAQPYFQHSQWVILHRRHVALLLDRAYLSWFAGSFAPDEHYLLNVLAHLKGVGPDEVAQQATTYVNWVDYDIKVYSNTDTGEVLWRSLHPKTYEVVTAADLARTASCWFFRKISAETDCDLIVDQVRAG